MTRFLTSEELRKAGRGIQTPFGIRVVRAAATIPVTCERVLRHLPGKRIVCRGVCMGRDVVIKFYLRAHGSRRHWDREKNGHRAMAAAGCRVAERVLEGIVEGSDIHVLVYLWVHDGKDLSVCWHAEKNDLRRIELLKEAVGLIAHHHSAGLQQDDLHFGNFLFSARGVYSLDGDAVNTKHAGKPLPRSPSIRNLALFFAQLPPKQDAFISELFRYYAEKRRWPIHSSDCKFLYRFVQRSRAYRKRKYLKKIFRESTDFICGKTFQYYFVYHRSWDSEAFRDFIVDPEKYFDTGERMKSGNTATIARIQVDGSTLVVKRYNIKHWRHFLRRCCRHTRAWVSWKNAHLLQFLGIPTPAPVALLEHRYGPLRSRAYFVMKPVHGPDAFQYLNSSECSDAEAGLIAKQFMALFRFFYAQKICHGDMKATNFILSEGGIKVIDLDGMRQYRSQILFRRAFRKNWHRWMKNWREIPFFAEQFSRENFFSSGNQK